MTTIQDKVVAPLRPPADLLQEFHARAEAEAILEYPDPSLGDSVLTPDLAYDLGRDIGICRSAFAKGRFNSFLEQWQQDHYIYSHDGLQDISIEEARAYIPYLLRRQDLLEKTPTGKLIKWAIRAQSVFGRLKDADSLESFGHMINSTHRHLSAALEELDPQSGQ